MAITKVQLTVSQIKEDLDNGMTWLKKNDQGYGSIQEKYNAKELDILKLRKHPLLKDLETNLTIFEIIDDTNETNNTSKESQSTRTNDISQQSVVEMVSKETNLGNSDEQHNEPSAADAFLNL